MKNLLLFFLLIGVVVCGFGQSIDSLLRYSRDVELLKKVAADLVDANNLPEAIKIYKKTGNIYRETDNFMQAVHYHNRGLELAHLLSDTIEIVQFLNQIGTNYRRMGALEDASTFHYNALSLCEQYSDKSSRNSLVNRVFSLNGIGNVYLTLNNLVAADTAFRAALAGETLLENHLGMAINYANIGALFQSKNMYDSARVYYGHSMKYNQLARSDLGISLCNIYFGRLAEIEGNFDEALKHYQEAYNIMENSSDRWHWLEACLAIADVYIAKNDMKSAWVYIEQAENVVQKIQSKESFAFIYKTKYRFYEKSGNPAKALENFILNRKYEDSILNINNINHISNLRLRYETELRDVEIEKQTFLIKQKHTERNILLICALVSILVLFLLSFLLRLRNRHNRELSEMNATKDKFFSIISHDLKNPAVAQRDALQLLSDNSDKMDAASLTKYHRKLLKSANAQVDLLFTLLGWAQLQTGRMPFHPAQFDLVAALQSCIGLIKNMADDKGVTFDVQTPETAIITGDYNMLTTVVRNLLVNAIKFTAKEGTVTLDISLPADDDDRDAACHVSTTKYVVSISDTGTGMNSEYLQNLFRLDSRSSHKGTAGEEGSGLGLIVCRELLQKHGSTLQVESEEGKGSRFWFEL